MQLFQNRKYETAATTAIETMRLMREENNGDHPTSREYKQAFEALSLMNSVRDMQLNIDGRIYATANNVMYHWKVCDDLKHEDIKRVNPDVVLLHAINGRWTDLTENFQEKE